MKQGKWTRITAVLFAAAMLVSLSACGDTTGDPPTTASTTTTTTAEDTTTTTTMETTTSGELSADMVERIKEDWMAENPVSDRRPEEDIILMYYGTYNGCVVLSIYDLYFHYIDEIWNENIGDVVFRGVGAYDLYVWRDGEFCMLKEVYAKNWVTKADVQNIAHLWNEKRLCNNE